MDDQSDTSSLAELPNGPPSINRAPLVAIILACCLIEAVLQLADFGLIEPIRLRALTYEYGGFWPGLVRDWIPNYPLQPFSMFLTYGFLHSGFLHLLVNMLTLWSLGQAVLYRVGTVGFGLVYLAAMLGGALGFAMLAPELRPMVGASGALFGLAGALLAWMYVDRYTYNQGLLPVAQTVLLLILLNLVLWWTMRGQLAWETHLGGFITGWLAATLVDPRATQDVD